jgi:hypothetical protein
VFAQPYSCGSSTRAGRSGARPSGASRVGRRASQRLRPDGEAPAAPFNSRGGHSPAYLTLYLNCHPRTLSRSSRSSTRWQLRMRDQFHVVHRTPNRVRLKFPARRHDGAFFAELQQRLRGRQDVAAVAVNPLTASVLVEYKLGVAGPDRTSPVPVRLSPLGPDTNIDARAVACRARLDVLYAVVELVLAWLTGQHVALMRDWCASWVMRLAVSLLSAPRNHHPHRLSPARGGPLFLPSAHAPVLNVDAPIRSELLAPSNRSRTLGQPSSAEAVSY